MRNFLSTLFLILFPIGIGVLFIVFGIKNHMLGRESVNWPSVHGSLVAESSSNRKKQVQVFYEYQVDGVTYKNYRVNFQDDNASKKRISDQYNVGDPIIIHYKSDRPTQSVLEPGAPLSSLLIKLAAGIFCFGLSGFFLLMRRR